MAAARPEPMNATPVHAKTRVTVAFSDPLFVAGQQVTGKVELECRADKGLGIGLIKAELFAIQELTSRDHSATSTFLHMTRLFQGPSLPPSNAVLPYPLPGSEPLPPDYFPARKGITTFFFRFPIPPSSPASIEFGKGLARLKYEVRASVDVAWKGERQTVMERKEVDVVEAVGEPAGGTEQVIVGENGKIWMQGRIVNPFLVAGTSACVELFVKNHSTKKSSSLNLTLSRHLRLPPMASAAQTLQISDVLLSVPFRGPDFTVQPGTEGVANLVFTVPKNARGVRSGKLDTGEEDENHVELEMESLFVVQCLITVKMGMGIGSKDITLDIPITVVHPAAMTLLGPPPAPPFASFQPQRQSTPERYASPMPLQNRTSPPQQLISYRSPYMSPPLSPQPAYYQAPYHSPPLSPPLTQINHWIPPQPMHLHPHDEQYYYPPPPTQHAPIPPLRPSSADPFVAQQLPLLPQQQHILNNFLVAPSPSVHALPAESTEAEVGKGERASRVSAHLRQSSRNRSVSPQSHRFPAVIPMVVTESVDEGTTVAPPSIQASRPLPVPRRSRQPDVPQDVAFLSASMTSNQSGEILSPRPMLSPKQSFSIDRGTVKSERVERLEQMAAADGEAKSAEVKDVEGDKQEMAFIDVHFESEGTPKLPPQPTLGPVAIFPKLDGSPPESGLDALERKLLLQVGTRKPEVTRRPDVRNVLPITIPSPSDPRCDPPNESAISSLALGADVLNDESKWPAAILEDHSERQEVTERPLPSLPMAKVMVKSAEPRRIGKHREQEKRSEAQELRKAATGRVAAWLGGIELGTTPPSCSTPPSTSPMNSSSDSDMGKLDQDPHPLLRSPANDAIRGYEQEQESQKVATPEIPTRSSGFVLHASRDSSPFNLPNPFEDDKQQSPSNSATNVVGNGTTGAETANIPKPVMKRFALQTPTSPLDAKYDIRSARGGRGGKVASVAAIWSSIATKENDPQAKRNVPLPSHRSSAAPRTRTSPTFPTRTKTPTPGPAQSNHTTANVNLAELTARRAKMIKSTSVPAVISSSLATPMISSTASLARPGPSAKKLLPPTVTATASLEPHDLSRPTPKTDRTNFGQARLKDLIRKYQQGQ